MAFGNLLQGVPFHLDAFLKPHYDATFLRALLPLLNPFALLADILSVCMVAMHGGLWLQLLRTEGVVRDRAKAAVGLLVPIVTVLFLIGGIWIYLGIDGFRIVSQPAFDAMPNPLAKEVVRAPGAWFDIYGNMPITMIVPLLGLVAPLLVRNGGTVAVFLRHAVQHQPELQLDGLGRRFQPSDPDGDVLGRGDLPADCAALHDLVLLPHVGEGDCQAYRRKHLQRLLIGQEEVERYVVRIPG